VELFILPLGNHRASIYLNHAYNELLHLAIFYSERIFQNPALLRPVSIYKYLTIFLILPALNGLSRYVPFHKLLSPGFLAILSSIVSKRCSARVHDSQLARSIIGFLSERRKAETISGRIAPCESPLIKMSGLHIGSENPRWRNNPSNRRRRRSSGILHPDSPLRLHPDAKTARRGGLI